jgi:ArsR family transcriptional regulator, arsenate/arsenite/antimonite-responsive transcriptional repressor
MQMEYIAMKKMIEIFKALSDRNRLRIVAALSSRDELCACQITELLQVTGATASRHLTVLSNAGLIESRKAGRWVFFRLKEQGIPVDVLGWMKSEFVASTEIKQDMVALEQITSCDPEDICRKQRGKECCPE